MPLLIAYILYNIVKLGYQNKIKDHVIFETKLLYFTNIRVNFHGNFDYELILMKRVVQKMI